MAFVKVHDESITSGFPTGPLLNSVMIVKPPAATSRLWLNLPPLAFMTAWVFILSLHVLCGVSLIVMGRIYIFMKNPNMVYWAKYFGGSTNPYFSISSIALTTVGALHLQQVCWILWDSLCERELVFRRKSKRTVSSRMQSIHNRVRSVIQSRRLLKKMNNTVTLLTFQSMKIIGRNGVLGVESNFFPLVFVIREIVEVSSQTYQANQSCNLIPRPWINHIMMTLLITNCWSTPILQHFVHGHPAVERIACLMTDALLNIGSSFIIPLTIFLPYYREFDMSIYSFPYKIAYDTLWFARLVTENRMLFALSFPNLLSRLVNHVSIFSSIASATTLIRRRPDGIESAELVFQGSVISVKALDPSTAALHRGNAKVNHYRSRVNQFAHMLFCVWGLVLLVIYSRAVYRSSKPMLGCRDTMAPWFTTKYPCSVFTFNCYRRQQESPIGNELETLDNDTMAFLVYAHCPALVIPTEIQHFPNMLAFQTHNCSIRSWTKEAAISAEKHTKLIAILLTRTNMTEFPEGLMGPLPSTVNDVEFSLTNLTSLPADLGQRWHTLSLLYFEFSELTEIPASVFQISVIVLSFVGNQIEYLPSLDDVHAAYYIVDLGQNPLQALPPTIGLGSYIIYLDVEKSQISSLPPWVYTNVGMPFGQESPYCLSLTSSTPVAVGYGCMVSDPRGGGRVPIDVIDSKITLLS